MILITTKLDCQINYVIRHYLTLYNNLVALIWEFINVYYPSKPRFWSNNIQNKIDYGDWLIEEYVLKNCLIQAYLFIRFAYLLLLTKLF